ncbi:hypothetical protein JNK13_09585 [bacterium]|nr:hypothetical protein [bacterium]
MAENKTKSQKIIITTVLAFQVAIATGGLTVAQLNGTKVVSLVPEDPRWYYCTKTLTGSLERDLTAADWQTLKDAEATFRRIVQVDAATKLHAALGSKNKTEISKALRALGLPDVIANYDGELSVVATKTLAVIVERLKEQLGEEYLII